MTLLTVSDLTCARGGIRLLDRVSFSLHSGRALILRGPNGSGKTTLLRTLAGLQRPVGGQVACGPDTIAYAAHADGIKPTLSVAENLHFWASVYGAGADPVGAMRAFQIETLAGRLAHNLSAGQKRRLGLARMLVTGRPVWAMDEPTVSLDAEAVALFADVVRAHLAAGGAAVIATHIDLGLTDAETLDIAQFRSVDGTMPTLVGDVFGEAW